MDLQQYTKQRITRVNRYIDNLMPASHQTPDRLHSAMRYAVLNGGKRMRPLLVYAAGELFGIPLSRLDPLAVALEMVHAYSLVHDDLPAMDNDDERRGKPSCHIFFDEATAILAGDALQTLCFEILSDDKLTPGLSDKQRLRMIRVISQAIGSQGMAGGQQLDMLATLANTTVPINNLEKIHILKTAKLIQAAVLIGALSYPELSDKAFQQLTVFGEKIGLAFQIRDDIEDQIQDQQMSAAALSYVHIAGVKSSEHKLHACYQQALCALDQFDARSLPLKEIAYYAAFRDTDKQQKCKQNACI